MNSFTVLSNLRDKFGRRYIVFMCSTFGHRPIKQEWFRVTNYPAGYMKGEDTFCKRCGELLERHINVDRKEK